MGNGPGRVNTPRSFLPRKKEGGDGRAWVHPARVNEIVDEDSARSSPVRAVREAAKPHGHEHVAPDSGTTNRNTQRQRR